MGTFVRRGVAGPTLADHTRLRRGLEEWVREARAAGLDQEDLRALFTVVLSDTVRAGSAKTDTAKTDTPQAGTAQAGTAKEGAA
ncbi:hypothetical protein ITP53_52230 [Nonomuraea sp. K274]|uniref:Uncharacterized protein n=1 Tax=Nonomuraea cypriaca TaxID=1187855 RepID=A0A931ASD6_9ACTN|nr:hypothetical protein [Nonomuraea cypriaca]